MLPNDCPACVLRMHFNRAEMLRQTFKGLLLLGDCYHPYMPRRMYQEDFHPAREARKPHSRSESCIAGWSSAVMKVTVTTGCRLYQKTNELFFLSKGTAGY